MATDVGSAVGYLDLDISGFLAGLKSAQSEADTASKNITTKIGNNLQSAGKSMTSTGSTLTKTVTAPILGLGTAAVKVTSDFESAMSKVSAISGATGGDLDALNKKAQEMGAKTKFSATESAEAFTYMAMAGWKTQDMLDGIDGIMNLAAADGLDLATTSDIVTDALTAFGLSASDSGHFADVLAKASSNANTNVSMLGESFKYAAPVAGALGYSAEDTAIALGLMANAGIKGSQGGTALRGSLTRLIKPTDDAAALMEQYGLSMTNADGSMKSLGEVMNMLRDRLGGLTEAEQAQVAAQIFGQEAMSGMLAIINASDSDYAKLTDAIYDADGAAQQMANTMLDNLSGQLTLLKSALEGLAIQFGEILTPCIEQLVSWLQDLTQKLQELTPEQKEQIVKLAAIAAAIGPVLMIFGKLTSSVGSIITTFGKIPGAIAKAKSAFTAVSVAIDGISAPVIAVVAVIIVLIAAFANLWKTNEEFRNKMTAIWDGIKSKFESFAQGIVDRLNALGFDFENFSEVVKAIWDGFCSLLAPVFEGAFQIISAVLGTVLDVLTGLFDVFAGIFTGNWDMVWTGVKEIFTGIWNGIKGIFEGVLTAIEGIADTVLGWFGTSWEEVWTNVSNFFNNIWEGIKTFFQNAVTTIQNVATTVFTDLKSFIENIFNGIKTAMSDAIETAKSNVVNAMTNAKDGIVNVFDGIIDTFKDIGENVIQGIIDGIGGMVDKLYDSIKDALSGLVGKAKDVLGISSPSKVFAKQIGRWLPPGVVQGFEAAMPSAMKSIQKDLNKGIDNIDTDDISVGAGVTVSGFADKLKSIYNEVALWFESIESRIGNSVDSMMQSLDMLIRAGQVIVNSDGTLGYIGYNGFTKSGDSEGYVDRTNPKDKNTGGNGDTFIFNSPKAIDEIEAAKQMKKTKQDMAEGF